ncbi:hypothetical protein G9A89_009264 [Geosiphon pyriformis]|nr:hypothetical protein G9A89_009264 [Geosiphon pyriformis]
MSNPVLKLYLFHLSLIISCNFLLNVQSKPIHLINSVFSLDISSTLLDELALLHENPQTNFTLSDGDSLFPNESPTNILESIDLEMSQADEQILSKVDDNLIDQTKFPAAKNYFDDETTSSLDPSYSLTLPGTTLPKFQSNQDFTNLTSAYFLPFKLPKISVLDDSNNSKQAVMISVSPQEAELFKKFAKATKAGYCARKRLNDTTEKMSVSGTRDNNGILVVFAGNEENFEKTMKEDEAELINYPDLPGVKIHKNLYETYLPFRKRIIQEIADYADTQPSNFRIGFFGYGLGGAYAQFAAFDLSRLLTTNHSIYVISYGQPRIGNEEFAIRMNKVSKVLRFTNKKDDAPRIPVKYQNTKFMHSGIEIWSTPKGDAIWCQLGNVVAGENNLCINSEPSKNPEDHPGPYFGIRMSDCGKL